MRLAILAALCVAGTPAAASPDGGKNPLDAYFEKYWAEEGITPGPASDDYEFLRRATLDVLGRLPTPDEIRAFVKSPDRSRKIDEFLASDDAAEYFADTWMRILMNYRFEETSPLKMNFPAFRGYLRDVYAKDLPYREFVTQLVSDHGDYRKKPASNFALVALEAKEPPHRLASRTSRIFLGLRIQCARCHDHPFERYTQEDFWGLTAFFKGLKPKARRTFDGYGIKLMNVPMAKMEMKIPDTETAVEARWLDGRKPEPGAEPRKELARFIVGSPQFPKAIVNRIWHQLMGRGFVLPIDDFRERSRPSHPELMETLCRELDRGETRLRPLMRTILTSRAYQAACATIEDADPKTHATMNLKPQNPVQVLNLLSDTLGLDTFLKQFYEGYKKNFDGNDILSAGYGNPEVFRMFLHLFTQGLLAPSGSAPEQSKYTGSIRLALKLMNSKDLQGLINANWGRLGSIIKSRKEPERRLEEIFLTLLSRPPDAEERERYLAYLKRKRGHDRAYEDIYWVLLNSTEMFFNH